MAAIAGERTSSLRMSPAGDTTPIATTLSFNTAGLNLGVSHQVCLDIDASSLNKAVGDTGLKLYINAFSGVSIVATESRDNF